ncbi:MAG TPA: hypothetical protein VM490_21085 [Armatimonadaceae bacterium]|nr:hypothetical protein [Armatimonadaceae bacterium]
MQPLVESIGAMAGTAFLLLPPVCALVTAPAALLLLHFYRGSVLRHMMTTAPGSAGADADTGGPTEGGCFEPSLSGDAAGPDAPPAPTDAEASPPPSCIPLAEITARDEVVPGGDAGRALLGRLLTLPRGTLGSYRVAALAAATVAALLSVVAVATQDPALTPRHLPLGVLLAAQGVMVFVLALWPFALAAPLLSGGEGRGSGGALRWAYILGTVAAFTAYFAAYEPAASGPGGSAESRAAALGVALVSGVLCGLLPSFPLLVCSGRTLRAIGPLALCAVAVTLQALFLVPGVLLLLGRHYGAAGAGVAAALAAAAGVLYLAVRLFGRAAERYAAKAQSDNQLMADAHYLLVIVWVNLLFFPGGTPAVWLKTALISVALFVVYRRVLAARLRPLRAEADAFPPRRMLLLRVFGSPKRSERLFDIVAHRWRHVGSIQLIAGTDLASATVEPHEFLDFLGGRLARHFVGGPEDLARKWESRDLAPDPDGRYRVNEFFCHDDTWQSVLARLLSDSDVVLMDLRGFTPARQGCVFELHRLVDSLPLGRIVLLVDDTTDVPFLTRVLDTAWDHRAADSPNRRADAMGVAPPLRLFRLPARVGKRDTRRLLALLADAAETDG